MKDINIEFFEGSELGGALGRLRSRELGLLIKQYFHSVVEPDAPKPLPPPPVGTQDIKELLDWTDVVDQEGGKHELYWNKSGGHYYLLAIRGTKDRPKQVVGFLQFMYDGKEIHAAHAAVDKESRRLGIATALGSKMAEIAREQGATLVLYNRTTETEGLTAKIENENPETDIRIVDL